jgi:hypothetical protein
MKQRLSFAREFRLEAVRLLIPSEGVAGFPVSLWVNKLLAV